jgi:hypothetical protein
LIGAAEARTLINNLYDERTLKFPSQAFRYRNERQAALAELDGQ